MPTIQQILSPEAVARLTGTTVAIEAAATVDEPAAIAEQPALFEPAPAKRTDKPATTGRVRRPQVAKHRPRTTDGVKHPVTTVNLDDMSDAQLGALIRRAWKEARTSQVHEQRAKAQDVAAANRAEQEALHAADQAARNSGHLVDGYEVRGVTIPVLDLREFGLDEVAPLLVHQPYSDARAAFGLDPLPEDTTWRGVAKAHIAMHTLARLAQG